MPTVAYMTEQLNALRGKQAASTPYDRSEWVRVGKTLRTIRELRGYDMTQFAELIGISRVYLNQIELGTRKLSNVLLARAATHLRVEQIAIGFPELPAEAEAGAEQ